MRPEYGGLREWMRYSGALSIEDGIRGLWSYYDPGFGEETASGVGGQ